MRSLIELDQLCGVFTVPPTLSTPNASDLEVDFAGQEPRVRKAAARRARPEGALPTSVELGRVDPSLNRSMSSCFSLRLRGICWRNRATTGRLEGRCSRRPANGEWRSGYVWWGNREKLSIVERRGDYVLD